MARSRERGATLVEFALVMPLLAIFLLGIVEFGVAYDRKQSMNTAAREGARFATLPDPRVSQIRSHAEDAYTATIDEPSGLITVEVYQPATSTTPLNNGQRPCRAPSGDGSVRVEASGHDNISIPFIPNSRPLIRSEAVFRCEPDS